MEGEIAEEKAALLSVEGAEVAACRGSFGGAAHSLGEGRQPLSTFYAWHKAHTCRGERKQTPAPDRAKQ